MPAMGKYVDVEKYRAMRIRSASKIQAMRARWRAVGACRECGLPCGVHVNTGRRYAKCLKHRRADALRWHRRQ